MQAPNPERPCYLMWHPNPYSTLGLSGALHQGVTRHATQLLAFPTAVGQRATGSAMPLGPRNRWGNAFGNEISGNEAQAAKGRLVRPSTDLWDGPF